MKVLLLLFIIVFTTFALELEPIIENKEIKKEFVITLEKNNNEEREKTNIISKLKENTHLEEKEINILSESFLNAIKNSKVVHLSWKFEKNLNSFKLDVIGIKAVIEEKQIKVNTSVIVIEQKIPALVTSKVVCERYRILGIQYDKDCWRENIPRDLTTDEYQQVMQRLTSYSSNLKLIQ